MNIEVTVIHKFRTDESFKPKDIHVNVSNLENRRSGYQGSSMYEQRNDEA